MMSLEVPENDQGNATQAVKENKRKNNAKGLQHSPEELQRIADVIAEAHGHMADPIMMEKVTPLLDKKSKALKGLSKLKDSLSKAKLREMRKGSVEE